MQDDKSTSAPQPEQPPANTTSPVSAPPQTFSYNQQNPVGIARERPPVDFYVVAGFLALMAFYTFFAGTTSSLNTGNGLLYFIVGLANLVLFVLVLLRIGFARRILIFLLGFNVIFYAFLMLNMAVLQNNLKTQEANYRAEIQKLEDKGIDTKNNKTIQTLNQVIEQKKTETNKAVGVFYMANTVNLLISVTGIVYFSTQRVKRVFH